jgi:hypothetical protein
VTVSLGRNSWPVTVIPTLGPPAAGSRPIVAKTGVGVGDGMGVGDGVGEGDGEGVGVGVGATDGVAVSVGVGVAVGLAATKANHRGSVASTLKILMRGTER